MEKPPLPIEESQSKLETASKFRILGGGIGRLSNIDNKTVGNAILKQLRTLKTRIAKGTRAIALLNMVLEGTSPIAISESKNATEESKTDTDSAKKLFIQKPQGVLSSTLDTMAAIMHQMRTLKALIKNPQNDIDRLKRGKTEEGQPDYSAANDQP